MLTQEQPAGKTVGWRATPEEIKLMEQLCAFHKRVSVSDLLRFLVAQEGEKILQKNIPFGITDNAKSEAAK